MNCKKYRVKHVVSYEGSIWYKPQKRYWIFGWWDYSFRDGGYSQKTFSTLDGAIADLNKSLAREKDIKKAKAYIKNSPYQCVDLIIDGGENKDELHPN